MVSDGAHGLMVVATIAFVVGVISGKRLTSFQLSNKKIGWYETMEKRSAYMEKIEGNLAELNKRSDEMKVKAGVAQNDIKAEYRAPVKKLGTKRGDFMVKYGELMNIQDKWTSRMNEASNHVLNTAQIADVSFPKEVITKLHISLADIEKQPHQRLKNTLQN